LDRPLLGAEAHLQILDAQHRTTGIGLLVALQVDDHVGVAHHFLD
jgi:hypothetical protein